ncbi:hypothetical protein [Streptomyces sp. NPDC046939]|uniref:hypothetical protein n=1 Tax=Streptomyces sp. NPDC046939 TaxID=3155376 RepID=UPI0033D43D27
MISATVSPAPAERLPRPVARRRALQLALLLGGLLGLGLLCGGQAHADDASGTLRHTAARESTGGGPQHPGVLGGLLGRDGASGHLVGTVRDTVLRPVLDTVDSTVQGAVRGVTQPVGELVEQVVDDLTSAAPRPLPDGPPTLPGLPGAPGEATPLPAPGEPGTPAPPASAEPPAPAEPTVPAHSDDPAQSTGAPGAVDAALPAEQAASTVPVGEGRAERRGSDAARAKRHTPSPYALVVAGPTAYDPAALGAVEKERAGAHPHDASAVRHAVAPGQNAPGAPAHPDGVPVAGASVGDGGGSRHGDLHAAAFGARRLPVLLPPGALASGTAAPVTDRHSDLPVPPG